MRDAASSEEILRREYQAEIGRLRKAFERRESVVRGLKDAAELPCIYDGDLDCPRAWPTSKVTWCLPCYARDAVQT